MPLEIKKEFFDTVAYSYRHNVIQIIKYLLEAGAAINGLEAQIEGIRQSITEINKQIVAVVKKFESIEDEIGDINHDINQGDLATGRLERDLEQLRKEFDAYTDGNSMDLTELRNNVRANRIIISDLTNRVEALEKGR